METNLFGISVKGIFWLRLTSNISQIGALASIVTEAGGKWAAVGLVVLGLVCASVASGNPNVVKAT